MRFKNPLKAHVGKAFRMSNKAIRKQIRQKQREERRQARRIAQLLYDAPDWLVEKLKK